MQRHRPLCLYHVILIVLSSLALGIFARAQQASALVEGQPVPYSLQNAVFEKGLKGEAIRILEKTGYAEINGAVPQPDTFTVEMYLKLDALPAGGVVAGRRSDKGSLWQIYTHSSGGLLFLAYGGGHQTAVEMKGKGTLQPKQWHHIAFTKTADGKLRFYLDGDVIFDEALKMPLNKAGDVPVRIGGLGFSGQAFNGLIEDVRIYSGELTKIRIAEIKKALVEQPAP